ncbi:MAG: flotillin family protein [Phycisphaerales bacterium]
MSHIEALFAVAPSALARPASVLAQFDTNARFFGPLIGLIGGALLLLLFFSILVVRQYKRCPSNRILVIYGKVGKDKSSKCMHGGGAFIVPLVQDYAFLSLEPIVIEVPLEGALSLNNIRVNVPATFTVAVSTDPVIMQNAAERLLNLQIQTIREQAQDIILGQLRLVIATMSIEEINKDREKFMSLINKNVAEEINKIGLELINVNIRDITDESGYIQAIGKRAAADAINRAKVEVAQAEREGATGEAIAVREKEVQVAAERAGAAEGQKLAEQKQRVAVAALEATAVQGEAQAQRDREITQAQRAAETAAARKLAEQEQRVRVADAEASAVLGENTAKQRVVESTALLSEVQADARRRSEVAGAKAQEAILIAQREQELAKLAKDTLAPQEIEKKRIELAADAEAERRRREAQGEADAILSKYEAEAAGVQKVMEAKAAGYQRLIEACGSDPAVGPTLLLIEQLPKLVDAQVRAIQGLKIDKIIVWDSGKSSDGRNSTAEFLSGLVGSLPKLHELAAQAGIELPPALGRIRPAEGMQNETPSAEAHSAKPGTKP